MTHYEIGSVANFVSQKADESNKKTSLQKNQQVLDQLFASSNSTVNTIVANVPIPKETIKKVKKSKRQADQYAISNFPSIKKTKDVKELDEDEVEKILDPGPDDDDMDNEEEESEKPSRKLKKNEIKNVKKYLENKGETKEDSDRVILVKNLPINIKRKTVHHFFAKFGKIDAVWLRCAALADPAMPKKVAVIKQEFHPNRQSISAFVRFQTKESAKQALSMTGCEFQERHIAVSLLSDANIKKQLSLGIFVGNLTFDIADEALWLHFEECGKISDVRVVRDRTNGMGKGFGYVNFESADSVELALKLDQSILNDRPIRVSRCKKNPKPFKTEEKSSGKEKENSKESGAYKRIKNKEMQEERKKGAGWITKMKKRNKESYHKAGKGNSFAGETTGADSIKVLKTGKAVKRNKEEHRKKVIAAKLAFVNKK
ncbi:LOW QUALITY PROTEIN: RNA-binding protein 34 [Daphnia magna]|uniref:LOW QUALITY PROTEIN: RNA-binding protein 34 n=1 Tax=Daphnia magna TaxID=35525 RepID=UPI001E1BAC16|nr:LOW QUALITY PROTEIN: RNA-binding protein 34 [Daphnia magna]